MYTSSDKKKSTLNLTAVVADLVLLSLELAGVPTSPAAQKQVALALLTLAAKQLVAAEGDTVSAVKLFRGICEGGAIATSPSLADLAAAVCGGRVERHEHVLIVTDDIEEAKTAS